jgi:hypothetical protein
VEGQDRGSILKATQRAKAQTFTKAITERRQDRFGMTSLQQAQGLPGERCSPYDRIVIIFLVMNSIS